MTEKSSKDIDAGLMPASEKVEFAEDADAAVLQVRVMEHAELEHSLSPRQAIQAYPMAIFWSLMVSFCVIMEGYDMIL